MERALIYKSLILTGLRSNELRTLRKNELSFGDVPFVVLNSCNEKNRKGSTIPLRSDLAAELRQWCQDKQPGDLVFDVPTGLLRILNRDLEAAGIEKIDESDGRVHLHAMRHSTGTHLSAAGVSPRTAQAVMRHSRIELTMNTYTDERLLETSAAVEHLPDLPITPEAKSCVAPTVAPDAYKTGQARSGTDKFDVRKRKGPGNEKPHKTLNLAGFLRVGDIGFEPTTSTMST
ncbi:tyrosine-type recombinase/integrase [Rosistilla ulvae]|uniref:tyrosine-type recombinase/integrase n=1 Tax=Rosistilla ulvae TaxID=1930277 RepID=UPI001FE6C6C4|nr:tyrosine-type recombinase/integrase [Rosistilla ulvae]